MKRELVRAILISLLGVTAHQAAAHESVMTSRQRHPSDATVPGRQILVSSTSLLKCPDVNPPWRGRPLFATDENPSPGAPVRFCEYRFHDDDTVLPRHLASLERDIFCDAGAAALPASTCIPPHGARLGADHLVIVPLASLPEVVAPALRSRFAYRAGEATWPPASGGLPPQLALLDTAPTSELPGMITSNSPHGDSLLHLAHTLLCDTTAQANVDCLAQITSQLALPYVEFDREYDQLAVRDDIRGGFLGTKSDLARAIRARVEAWAKGEADRDLVINLSVAWDPIFGDVAPPDSPLPGDPGAEAVYAAILDARCHGALVVAASGNRVGGPGGILATAYGAMLPAAWEQRAVNSDSCLGFEDAQLSNAAVPLVYAAGGVDLSRQPLANARIHSEPPRVAFADHAYAKFSTLQAPPSALTGSSVASLVVSAAAAAVWRFQPTLSADQVMTLVYDSGTLLAGSSGPRVADVFFSGLGSPPNVRVVEMCSAVTAACSQGNNLCLANPACAIPSPNPVDWSLFDPTISPQKVISFPQLVAMSFGSLPPVLPPHDCGNRPLHVPNGVSLLTGVVCPDRQFYSASATPWAGPQPEQDLCPGCASSPTNDNGSNALVGPTRAAPVVRRASPAAPTTEVQLRPGEKSLPHHTLRVEIPSPIIGILGAPTLTTSQGIYRFSESIWPCKEAGDRCLITQVPHHGNEPIELSFSVNPDEGAGSCDPTQETCWSVTIRFLDLP